MQHSTVEKINQAVQAAREIAVADLSSCDLSDIDEIIAPIERELKAPLPNTQTLGSFLNSLARSLRSDPAARTACLQLDEAMREAGIVADWSRP